MKYIKNFLSTFIVTWISFGLVRGRIEGFSSTFVLIEALLMSIVDTIFVFTFFNRAKSISKEKLERTIYDHLRIDLAPRLVIITFLFLISEKWINHRKFLQGYDEIFKLLGWFLFFTYVSLRSWRNLKING